MSRSSTPRPVGRAEDLRRRGEALAKYERWQTVNPRFPAAEAALSAVGFLYDLLPEASRQRAVDTSGVARMHASLAVLGTSARG